MRTQASPIAPKQPDPKILCCRLEFSPISSYTAPAIGTSGSQILIMGGQSAISIDQFPLLKWYQQEFKSFLSRPEARLMVIGYSFGDKHVNDAIGERVERGPNGPCEYALAWRDQRRLRLRPWRLSTFRAARRPYRAGDQWLRCSNRGKRPAATRPDWTS